MLPNTIYMKKTIYCIRHGTALHNINFKTMGHKAYTSVRDTPLVEQGIKDAHYLENTWDKIYDIELVVVSPLSRTLHTADIIFKNCKIPTIVLDQLKEYPQSNEICNFRNSKSNLKQIYPSMDFTYIQYENDNEWCDTALPTDIDIKKLKERIYEFKKWISKRPEKTIAVVGHSSYFNMLINGHVDCENTALKHCHPYKIEL